MASYRRDCDYSIISVVILPYFHTSLSTDGTFLSMEALRSLQYVPSRFSSNQRVGCVRVFGARL